MPIFNITYGGGQSGGIDVFNQEGSELKIVSTDVSGVTQDTAYTVPAGKKAIVTQFIEANTDASSAYVRTCYKFVNRIGSTLYTVRQRNNVQAGSSTFSAPQQLIVMEEDDEIVLDNMEDRTVTLTLYINEFDATSPVETLMSNSTNADFQVPAGKKWLLPFNQGVGTRSSVGLISSNASFYNYDAWLVQDGNTPTNANRFYSQDNASATNYNGLSFTYYEGVYNGQYMTENTLIRIYSSNGGKLRTVTRVEEDA